MKCEHEEIESDQWYYPEGDGTYTPMRRKILFECANCYKDLVDVHADLRKEIDHLRSSRAYIIKRFAEEKTQTYIKDILEDEQ